MSDKVIARIGEEAAKQLYDGIFAQVSQVAATKVDRTDYDAHSALIAERFERFRAEVLARLDRSDAETDKKITNARLSTILWTVGLVATITGGWSALIISMLR